MLDLQGPVLRVTGYDVPYPYWQIEDAYMPSVARVVDAARSCSPSRTSHELPLDPANLHGHFSRDLEPVLTVDPATRCGSRCRTPGGRSLPASRRVPRPGARQRSRAGRADRDSRRARWPDARGHDRRGRAGLVGRHLQRAAAPDRLGADGRHRARGGGRTRAGWRRSSACSGCRRRSPASTRRSRRGRGAGTSTARSSSPGTTLYLPIPVDGALFSAGDAHAAQGDGEVSGTAIECPVEAQLTLDAPRRPAARVARGADRRRLADLRLRRASRPGGEGRGRRDARPDGARARAGAARRTRARDASWSTCA